MVWTTAPPLRTRSQGRRPPGIILRMSSSRPMIGWRMVGRGRHRGRPGVQFVAFLSQRISETVQEHVYNTTVPATCLPHIGFAGVWTPATHAEFSNGTGPYINTALGVRVGLIPHTVPQRISCWAALRPIIFSPCGSPSQSLAATILCSRDSSAQLSRHGRHDVYDAGPPVHRR